MAALITCRPTMFMASSRRLICSIATRSLPDWECFRGHQC